MKELVFPPQVVFYTNNYPKGIHNTIHRRCVNETTANTFRVLFVTFTQKTELLRTNVLSQHRHVHMTGLTPVNLRLTTAPSHQHPTPTTHNVAHTLHQSAFAAQCSPTLCPASIPRFLPRTVIPEDGFRSNTHPHATPPDNPPRKCHSSATHFLPSEPTVLTTNLHTTALADTLASPTIPSAQHINPSRAKSMDALHHALQHPLQCPHIHLDTAR
jgi:hypothetical protein